MGFAGLLVDALNVDEGSRLFGGLNRRVVGDHTVQKSLARLGVLHVLDSDVDALGDDAAVVLKIVLEVNASSNWVLQWRLIQKCF